MGRDGQRHGGSRRTAGGLCHAGASASTEPGAVGPAAKDRRPCAAGAARRSATSAFASARVRLSAHALRG